jgi:hypothetical protein
MYNINNINASHYKTWGLGGIFPSLCNVQFVQRLQVLDFSGEFGLQKCVAHLRGAFGALRVTGRG